MWTICNTFRKAGGSTRSFLSVVKGAYASVPLVLCPFSAEYKGKAANTIFGLKQLTGASKLIGGAALVSLGMKSSVSFETADLTTPTPLGEEFYFNWTPSLSYYDYKEFSILY